MILLGFGVCALARGSWMPWTWYFTVFCRSGRLNLIKQKATTLMYVNRDAANLTLTR